MRRLGGPSVCTYVPSVSNVHVLPLPLDGRIRFAIAHRRLIQVGYKGVLRMAEPHDYGSQNGVDRLLVFQLRGPARTNQSETGWRLLDVPKIESLDVLDGTFRGSRGSPQQHHHAWDVVYERVS
jgi:hypothetical protein